MEMRDAIIRDGAKTTVPDVRLSLERDLTTLEPEWCAFEQRADCTVFQSFGWLATWYRHIGRHKGVQPAIVIGREAGGDILFLLPLSVESRHLGRRLTWLGSGTNDYNAPLLAPDFSAALAPRKFASLWPAIMERIRSDPALRFDLIHLERMPQRVGSQANPFLEVPVTIHPSGAYLTHLAGDWDSFYASRRSSATRKRDRRKRKHLEELGGVSFVTPEDQEELARSFDTLVAQKTRSFAARGVPNMFRRTGCADFYRSLAMNAATRPIVHLSRLDVGGQTAAVSLGLTFRGSYYLVLSSYDVGELSRFSPGSAHLHELMRHAIDADCTVFDFTVGDEPYKRDWSENESMLFDHVSAARPYAALVALPLLGSIRLKRAIKQTDVLWGMFNKARAFVGRLVSGGPARAGSQPRGEAP
jgi:CelD/BcsL family acetyltransferase involved in cellulose biosynthesis